MPALLGVAGLVSAAIFWVAIQSSVRFTLWSTVSEWQPTNIEHRKLAECRPPGWWAWLKVLAKDRAITCGETWAAQAVASKITVNDREQWLRDWVESTESSPLRRLRASLALSVAGRPTPAEPAWLSLDPDLPQWPTPGLASAIAEEAPWGVHLGPRWMALGKLWAVSVSGQPAEEAVPALEALWALGDPTVGRVAVSAVARGLDAPPDLLQDARYRRRRGLHAGTLPDGWAEAIGRRPTCEEPCLELWIDLLRLEAAVGNDGPIDDPPTVASLRPLSGVLGYTGVRGRALSWWIDAAAAWVTAAPEPARRLASLGLGAEEGAPDPIAVVWERGGTPWMTVAVLEELGRRVGLDVDVRANGTGTVEVVIGDQRLSRPGCGGATERPAGSSWPRSSLHAAALAEAALHASRAEEGPLAMRLAAAAERLDPVLTEGLLQSVQRRGETDGAHERGLVVGSGLAAAGSVPADAARPEREAYRQILLSGCP